MKVAIVSAYYDEPRATLERCLASVAAQTRRCTHFLVSDGAPQDFLDRAGVRHLRLGANHRDYGDTPRAIGSVLAAREGFDAIGYLDADNEYEPDHVERMVEACAGGRADVVVASRSFVRADGTVAPYEDSPPEKHVDTSCLFLAEPAFWVAPLWATMPREFSALGDRFVWAALRNAGMRWVHVPEKTVRYRALWVGLYRQLGEKPPPGAKDLRPELDRAVAWWRARSEDEKKRLCRHLRIPYLTPEEVAARERAGAG